MATVNLEHQYIEFKDSMKVSDDKIYFINREGKYVKLTELYIFNGINNRATRKVKDYKDFVNNRSKISFSANNHVGVFNPLVKVFDVPNYYETTSNLTNIDEVNAGYKKYCKIAKVNRAEADKNNDFAMVFIANSSKPSFIKISDIYYYDGLTKKYINDLTRDNVAGKDLHYKDRVITSIYTGAMFRLEKLKEETFNPETFEKTTYSVSFKSDGTPEFKEEVVRVDSRIVTHDIATMLEDAGKNNGQTIEVSAVAIKEYNISSSANAKFIRVVLENQLVSKIVSIEDLYTESNEQISDLNSYVGKPILVKIGEKFYKTNPLTLDQVTVKYATREYYNPSSILEDALKENSYLMMQDGTYKKETDVAKPMYFTFEGVTDENFDVYVATVTTKSGEEKQIIIDKNHYDNIYKKNMTATFSLDGYNIHTSNVHKARRTNDFSKCDAIQTTSSGNKVEFCKIYKPEQRTAEEQSAQQAAFEDLYKQGQYQLKKVFVKNEAGQDVLVEVDNRRARYLKSDTMYVKNAADQTTEYVALNEQPFSYVSENGELGKITGGPGYNVGKAIGKSMSNWIKSVGYGMAFLMSPAGILSALAFPPVVAAGIAAAVIAPIIIPIYQGIKGVWKNSFGKYKWSNQSKFNENVWRKDLENELQQFYTQTKNSENRTETKFLNECEHIDSIVARLLKANHYAGFEMVDGKVDINSQNVHAVTRFMAEAKQENEILKGEFGFFKRHKLERLVKKLTKKGKLTEQEELELNHAQEVLANDDICKRYHTLKKKNPESLTDKEKDELTSLEVDYTRLENSFKLKMSNYRCDGYSTEPDENSRKLVESADRLKSFLYLKYFANEEKLEQLVSSELSLTTDEEKTKAATDIKELLKEIEYNFTDNKIVCDNTMYFYETCMEDPHSYYGGPTERQTSVIKTLRLIKSLMESETVKNVVAQVKETEVEIPVAEEVIPEETAPAVEEVDAAELARREAEEQARIAKEKEAKARIKKTITSVGKAFGATKFTSTGALSLSEGNVKALIKAMQELEKIGNRINSDEFTNEDDTKAHHLCLFYEKNKRLFAKAREAFKNGDSAYAHLIDAMYKAEARYNSYNALFNGSLTR